MPETPTLISITEAAAILGKHPKTLRLWHKTGKLSAVMSPSGQHQYRLADIHALINGSPQPQPESIDDLWNKYIKGKGK